jgi:arylsulfatase
MGERKRTYLWLAAAVIAGGTALFSAGRERPPSVLLITIDTLRVDRLSGYGYQRPTSPNLDRLGREGAVFESCYSASNSTNPSHTSILTGTRVTRHGVVTNQTTFAEESIPLLFERFRAAGYETAAVVSVAHLNRTLSGLGRGVDDYFDAQGERRAESSVVLARTWIAARADRRFFLWLHLFDPHMMYDPPAPFDTAYPAERSPRLDVILRRSDAADFFRAKAVAEEERRFLEKQFSLHFIDSISFNQIGLTPSEIGYLHALYDGEITYTDTALAGLFRELEDLGIRDETLVVLTADHGEAFGEHGIYCDHRSLYEETLRVPLILRYPDAIPAGLRVQTPVSGIDIAPTILDYAGLPADGEMDGRSLRPALDQSELVSEPILAEHAHALASMVRDGPWKLIVSRTAARAGRIEARQEEASNVRKLRTLHPNEHELFNLVDDMGEVRDQSTTRPDVVERLLAMYAARSNGRAAPPTTRAVSDPAALERLRALGYED